MMCFIPKTKPATLPDLLKLPGLVFPSVEVVDNVLRFDVNSTGDHFLPVVNQVFVYNGRQFIVCGLGAKHVAAPPSIHRFVANALFTFILRNGPPQVEGQRLACDEPPRSTLELPFYTPSGGVIAVFTVWLDDGQPRNEAGDTVYLFDKFKPKEKA